MVGRAEELPFDAGRFEVVVAIGILQYTERERSLVELARVLRPGGRAVIGFQNGRSPALVWRRVVVLPTARAMKRVRPFGHPVPPRRQSPISEAQARALLVVAGFEIERSTCVGCAVLPDPLDRLTPRLGYRLARAAERSARLRRVLGTQRLIAVRKI